MSVGIVMLVHAAFERAEQVALEAGSFATFCYREIEHKCDSSRATHEWYAC